MVGFFWAALAFSLYSTMLYIAAPMTVTVIPMAFSRFTWLRKMMIDKKIVTTCLTFPTIVTVRADVTFVKKKLHTFKKNAMNALRNSVNMNLGDALSANQERALENSPVHIEVSPRWRTESVDILLSRSKGWSFKPFETKNLFVMTDLSEERKHTSTVKRNPVGWNSTVVAVAIKTPITTRKTVK